MTLKYSLLKIKKLKLIHENDNYQLYQNDTNLYLKNKKKSLTPVGRERAARLFNIPKEMLLQNLITEKCQY